MKAHLAFIVLSALLIAAIPGCNSTLSTETKTQTLAGTSWTLESFGDTNNVIPAVTGRTITLRFYESGSYMGSPGFTGSYGGTYKTEGNAVRIGAPTFAAVAPQDDPPGFLVQYQTYFSLLSRARDFEIKNDELLINCGDSKSLIFRFDGTIPPGKIFPE